MIVGARRVLVLKRVVRKGFEPERPVTRVKIQHAIIRLFLVTLGLNYFNLQEVWTLHWRIMMLKATATKKVQVDLVEMLNVPKCVKFVNTVNTYFLGGFQSLLR
ncbi:hypothetical protein L2E82_42469 [Cichorium intybus]|uniref:Uncharacterized protein n=1 Tax=Cichorium intybus TaxID=13427 RepID=A0ACB8ZMD4_CICIN|nr:hypothetical protein L2E82_42469 [Cichorium intybus]